MWGFVASLFLVILYPGSLLLPAIFGFLVQLSTAAFGTLVGDWVDANPRMRGEKEVNALFTTMRSEKGINMLFLNRNKYTVLIFVRVGGKC